MTTAKQNRFGFTYQAHEEKQLFDPDYKYCALLWSHISNEPGGKIGRAHV